MWLLDHLFDFATRYVSPLDFQDGDGQATLEEFENVRYSLAGTDAQYHFIEWVQHHEL